MTELNGFAACCLLFLLWFVGAAQAAADATPEATYLEVAVVQSEAAELPSPAAAWRCMSMPHREMRPATPGLTTYWYKANFIFRAGAEPPWILLPKIRSGGKLYVNGVEMARVSESTRAWQIRSRHPYLLLIPASALRDGMNQVAFRMPTRDPYTSFGGIWIGAEPVLRGIHDDVLFREHTLHDIMGGIALAVGAFVCAIWYRRPKDPLFGWFGVAMLAWSLFSVLFRIPAMPMSLYPAWSTACYVTFGAFFVALLLCLFHYLHIRSRWIRAVLVTHWLAISLAAWIVGPLHNAALDRAWVAGIVPSLLYGGYVTATAAKLRRQTITVAIVGAIGLLLFFLLHDYAARTGQWPMAETYLLHLALPCLLLVAGMVGLMTNIRPVTDAHAALHTAADLVSKPEEAGAVLHQRVLAEERQRIMREMHDGIGSHLLSTLVIAQSGRATSEELVELLKECIDEMRLSIDGLAQEAPDFLAMLGNFRFRMEARFQTLGLPLVWHHQALPAAVPLDADTSLQLMRILQEALTNVLKHARATRVEVDLTLEENVLQIRVSDNGVGIDSTPRCSGYGIGNMQSRAAKIGAQLTWRDRRPGTELTLHLPLRAGPTSAAGTPATLPAVPVAAVAA